MNLYNSINCRVVDDEEKNVFKTLFNNSLFWVILLGELFLQDYMITLGESVIGSAIVGTAALTFNQKLTCHILGALTLAIYPASKMIPL